MSVTHLPSASATDLLKLARTAENGDRATLYHKIADLFQRAGPDLSGKERLLLMEIMGRLTRQVEMDLRMRLAESLADEPTANHDLILLLANDAIEVATPLILRSGVLTDNDLIGLIDGHNEDHQVVVARRPNISKLVSRSLFQTGNSAVWCALSANATAEIDDTVLGELTDRSRQIAALQEPLLTRADLPVELAERMYTWVSDALKAHIVHNFKIDPTRIDIKLRESIRGALKAPIEHNPRYEQVARLVDKLYATGQLKPSYLIKSLREGQRDMFELAFAKLLNHPIDEVEDLIARQDLTRLAYAVRAAGIDRSAFGTVAVALYGKSTLECAGDPVKQSVQAALRTATPEEARQHAFA